MSNGKSDLERMYKARNIIVSKGFRFTVGGINLIAAGLMAWRAISGRHSELLPSWLAVLCAVVVAASGVFIIAWPLKYRAPPTPPPLTAPPLLTAPPRTPPEMMDG